MVMVTGAVVNRETNAVENFVHPTPSAWTAIAFQLIHVPMCSAHLDKPVPMDNALLNADRTRNGEYAAVVKRRVPEWTIADNVTSGVDHRNASAGPDSYAVSLGIAPPRTYASRIHRREEPVIYSVRSAGAVYCNGNRRASKRPVQWSRHASRIFQTVSVNVATAAKNDFSKKRFLAFEIK